MGRLSTPIYIYIINAVLKVRMVIHKRIIFIFIYLFLYKREILGEWIRLVLKRFLNCVQIQMEIMGWINRLGLGRVGLAQFQTQKNLMWTVSGSGPKFSIQIP